jgi:hypothetical protein
MSGNVHTNFIEENRDTLFKIKTASETQLVQAALAVVLRDELTDIGKAVDRKDQFNPFVVESGFRLNYHFDRDIKFRFKTEGFKISKQECQQSYFLISRNCSEGKIFG